MLGGGTALASHAVKAGLRLAVNTSPEPVTNVGTSVLEDVAVVGVLLLAVAHPWLAMAVSLTLLAVGAGVVCVLVRRSRRGWRRWSRRGNPVAEDAARP